jgi:hypothetical protein
MSLTPGSGVRKQDGSNVIGMNTYISKLLSLLHITCFFGTHTNYLAFPLFFISSFKIPLGSINVLSPLKASFEVPFLDLISTFFTVNLYFTLYNM